MRVQAKIRSHALSLLALLALVRVLIACSTRALTCTEGQVGADQARIIDGVAATAADFDGVLKATAFNRSCTVSRVADKLLLMAAHCFSDLAPGDTVLLSRGASDPKFSGEFRVKNVSRHPSYTGNTETAHNESDVAVVELATSIDPSIVTAAVDTSPSFLGESLTMVGYGCNDFVDDVGTGAGTRRFGTAVVSQMYPGMLRTSGPAYACPGDSGGPAFRQGAAQRIVGIISSGDFAVEAGPSRSNLARLEIVDAWLRSLSVTMFSDIEDAAADASNEVAPSLDAASDAGTRCIDGSLVTYSQLRQRGLP